MERNSNKQVLHVYQIMLKNSYNYNLVGVEHSIIHPVEHLKRKRKIIHLMFVNKFNLQLSIVHMSKTHITFALLNS